MGLIDRIFGGGPAIRDYGLISEYRVNVAKFRVSAQLVDRKGRTRFVMKSRAVGPLASGNHYVWIEEDDLPALKAAVDDAERYFRENQEFRRDLGQQFTTPEDGPGDRL